MKKFLSNIRSLTLPAITIILLPLILFHSEFEIILHKGLEAKYKREIRKMIKAGVPEDQLVSFVFPRDIREKTLPEFKWTKSNEFRYKGEMYDIVKEEILNDSIVYRCIHDVKESGLFKRWESYLDEYISKNPDKKSELITILETFNKYYSTTEELGLCEYPAGNLFFPGGTIAGICEEQQDIPPPPPKHPEA